jgi:predicted DNA-binding protein
VNANFSNMGRPRIGEGILASATVTMPADTVERIRAIAEEEGSSFSAIWRRLAEHALAGRKPKKAPPRKGGPGLVPVSAAVSEEMIARVRAIAEADDRSGAYIWRQIIDYGLGALYGPEGTTRCRR